MGEFTSGGYNHSAENMKNQHQMDMDKDKTYQTPDGFECDGIKKHGNDEFPIFNVDGKEFNQNMMYGRKRLHFKSGSKAQQYMQGTKYKRPFFIKTTTDDGKEYIRKIDK